MLKIIMHYAWFDYALCMILVFQECKPLDVVTGAASQTTFCEYSNPLSENTGSTPVLVSPNCMITVVPLSSVYPVMPIFAV